VKTANCNLLIISFITKANTGDFMQANMDMNDTTLHHLWQIKKIETILYL